jgi:hypothetical protein
MSMIARLWLCLLMVTVTFAIEDSDLSKIDFNRDIKPLLSTYCYECHGNKKSKGDVNVERYNDMRSVQIDLELWLDVKHMLDENEMPPADHMKRPTGDERARLSAWIKWSIDNVDPALVVKDPGSVVLHRLNKAEFNNTYRDLLGVKLGIADSFPDDNGGDSGFDNSADTLFAPTLFIEKLLAAAAQGLEQAPFERLFPKQPATTDSARDQKILAKELVETFLERAWRRPVGPGEVDRLLKIYDVYIKKKAPWETAMRQTYRQILISPAFIYRAEQVQLAARDPYEIGHYDMANRLSYFIWSSMPDDELFQLAKEEKLQDPAIIDQQVMRMFKDKKAKTFGHRFAGQWLETNTLRAGGGPDRDKFPAFTDHLRDSMCDEPGEFFNGLIEHNRSILDLIDSDYVYANEELAKIYGIRGISGNHLRQVPRPDKGRGGVVTMPAVLALTSNPQRTSPVLRGAWVLSQILNAPPPPPPPNVPPLDEEQPMPGAKAQKELTLRERLEKHRGDPTCASCHNRIDPIGFGLEGYNVLGETRARDEHGNKLDTSGSLLTGESFANAEELKIILMKRKETFARTVVEKLLAYALGRKLESFDRPTLNELTKQLIADDYRIQGLLKGIAHSYPMRFKRNAPIKALTN